MHISCPRCDTVINAKDCNLFNIWTCKKCSWRFRGVHANQPHLRNFINSWIAPFYTNSNVWDLANCPDCGSLVDLNWIGLHTKTPRSFGHFRNIGYNGPYVCKRCCKNLPWDYPAQHPWVAKEWNEEVMRERGESAVETKQVSAASTHGIDLAEAAEFLYKKKHGMI